MSAVAEHECGAGREASQHLEEAERRLDRLFGRGTPHQDRVAALLTRSWLETRPQEAEEADARARAMADRMIAAMAAAQEEPDAGQPEL
jgi:hypothetical protein